MASASIVAVYIDGSRIDFFSYSTTFEIISIGFIVDNTQVWTYSGDSVFAGFSQNDGANFYPVGTTGTLSDFTAMAESINLYSVEGVEPSTYYKVSSADLKSVADAIRAKSGTSEALVYPDGFISAIESIVG